jgi:hypothetical protein
MPAERDVLRDWHRLFGLLLTDFFTGSPFVVEVERKEKGDDVSSNWQLAMSSFERPAFRHFAVRDNLPMS